MAEIIKTEDFDKISGGLKIKKSKEPGCFYVENETKEEGKAIYNFAIACFNWDKEVLDRLKRYYVNGKRKGDCSFLELNQDQVDALKAFLDIYMNPDDE